MVSQRDIADLGPGWRIADGLIQVRERVILISQWTPSQVPELAARLAGFVEDHVEAVVTIEHSSSRHPDDDCDYSLEVEGWRTVDSVELQQARAETAAARRAADLERRRLLEADAERSARELAELQARLGDAP